MDLYTRKLEVINDSFRKLLEIKKESPSFHDYDNSWRSKDITERNLHKVIEAIVDIGKMLISDKKLREPGNNREVFIILSENSLFPSEHLPLIEKMSGMRNILVHSYDRVDDSIVYGVLQKNLKDIKKMNNYFKKLVSEIIKRKVRKR
ncbi:MAG: hypothetical protein COZ31_02365 [Nitrospirae bacterium CG_4_10_14_3_um_filter_44_29]|nr:DUF86 domain-containing protein [Nitrospirota bacterium]PIP70980.1 MAG: hypothetical protein COW90_02435 [Nitrospirae bacterium CG22_combo_CG10-13_8_21_14_all_44_11]PIV40702.1 MAG: hypothetical protein COS28_07365 [Nitrospirae bacterium CG02_land_8_20_14_3_00_44_33]PIV67530.1 MAG: hypothetical protein COS10_00515 [Nitrospirae bacterium CG01_land_8_20_14_3_00_44_22]PIX89381.1 MAG: hypothetical protein COZ31_02365 [Nitrospirae bacterium CG_4_10_14_3_um_filter_44_29]PJA83358.1 MAG: hypothetica